MSGGKEVRLKCIKSSHWSMVFPGRRAFSNDALADQKASPLLDIGESLIGGGGWEQEETWPQMRSAPWVLLFESSAEHIRPGQLRSSSAALGRPTKCYTSQITGTECINIRIPACENMSVWQTDSRNDSVHTSKPQRRDCWRTRAFPRAG